MFPLFQRHQAWLVAVRRQPSCLRWYPHWLSSLAGRRTPLGDGLPWMTYGAIAWLRVWLTPGMRAFEWGSGGSTAFFAAHGLIVTAIEHDRDWHAEVISSLRATALASADVRHVPPIVSAGADAWHQSHIPGFTDLDFRAYVEAICGCPDESLDLVSVDGRARPGCIRESMAKLKPGGVLLLDNSERPWYEPGIALVQRWHGLRFAGPGPYLDHPWETRIWHKPAPG